MTSLSPEPAGLARKTLLVVDDHPILRRGLTALIASEPGLAVHAAVGTRVAALAAIRRGQPDLAIVDIALGDEDGLDLVKEIKARYPKVPSLVLSVHEHIKNKLGIRSAAQLAQRATQWVETGRAG
jgi:DNA-binding NarL/FixJ family response regulator